MTKHTVGASPLLCAWCTSALGSLTSQSNSGNTSGVDGLVVLGFCCCFLHNFYRISINLWKDKARGVLYLDFTETFQLLGKMNQNIIQIGQSLVPNGLLVSSEKFNDLRSRAGTQAGGGRKTVHSPHRSYTTPPRLSVGRLVVQVEHFWEEVM